MYVPLNLLTMAEELKVFISYSHKDAELKQQLDVQLVNLKRTIPLDIWSDNMIVAGQDWNEEISSKLKASQVILLLISPDFIASDYAYDKEMKEALNMHDFKQALVVPVMLRTIKENGLPFSKIQTLPSSPRFVNEWSNLDAAFTNVLTGLELSIQQFVKNRKVRDINARENELVEYAINGELLGACDKLMDFASDFSAGNDYRREAMTIKGTCKYILNHAASDAEQIHKIICMILKLIDDIKLSPVRK